MEEEIQRVPAALLGFFWLQRGNTFLYYFGRFPRRWLASPSDSPTQDSTLSFVCWARDEEEAALIFALRGTEPVR